MLLEKYINIDTLQELQNCFSLSTGLASVTVDYKGIPLLEQSGFTKFCTEVRKIDYYKKKCFHCDAYNSMESARTGQPSIYYCHAGLVDFSVPIIIDGAFLGSIMCGQVKVKDFPKKFSSFVSENDYILDKYPALEKYYSEIKVISYDALYQSTKLLSKNLQLLINEANLVKENTELHKLYKDTLQDNFNLSQLHTTEYKRKNEHHFFLGALNLIQNQAFLEDASEVEDLIIATSTLYRYYLKDYKNLVSLQKELNYIKHYNYIQNLRFGELFKLIINIPNELYKFRIPHLILLILIENSFKYSIEPKEFLGTIQVSAKKTGNKINIILEDDGLGIDEKNIVQLNNISNFYMSNEILNNEGFFDIYVRLNNFFKDDFIFKFSKRKNGGLKICLTFPAVLEKNFISL